MTNEQGEQVEAIVPIVKAPLEVSSHTFGGLVPRDLDQLWRMATWIAKSGMAPKGMQSPEAVAVAIQMGLEVGISPMQSVQNIAVIGGRPSIWGDAALALVRASGELEDFEEWKTGEEYTDTWTAHCKVRRRGDTAAVIETFSWADAKKAKLTPADELSPWSKYPKRMLQMRARSWPLRDKFTDLLKGLQIREEAADVVHMTETAKGSYQVQEKTEQCIEDLKERIEEEKIVLPPDAALISHFKNLRSTGLEKYISDNIDAIPDLPPRVWSVLNAKCRKLFKLTVDEYRVKIREDMPSVPPKEKIDSDKDSIPDREMPCPNTDGETRYESYCRDQTCREDCPSFEERTEE